MNSKIERGSIVIYYEVSDNEELSLDIELNGKPENLITSLIKVICDVGYFGLKNKKYYDETINDIIKKLIASAEQVKREENTRK